MKVRVQFFSQLKDIAGVSGLEVDVADGIAVGGLLGELYTAYPGLRAWDSRVLIGAGVEFVDRDYVIQPGDEIAIMPPVQGG